MQARIHELHQGSAAPLISHLMNPQAMTNAKP
jgi:hypothetical protein